MELDIFITETLKSIVKGISDSQEFAIEHGARINPHVGKWDKEKVMTSYIGNEEGIRPVTTINFDIAVTATAHQEIGGQGGINVLSVKLGGQLSDKTSNESVSRIQFSVNAILPSVNP